MKNLMSRKFVDSNIWLYRLLSDPTLDPLENQSKRLIAIDLTQSNHSDLVVSTQVIAETCAVLKRKTRISDQDIFILVEEFSNQCEIVDLTIADMKEACKLRERYSFSYWDSLIVATAIKSSSKILYSEDMQHGLVINGMLEIVNPFL